VLQEERAAVQTKRRWLSPGDDPLVRAVARLPARVHVKLLVAFVSTALLVVGVSLLGLRLLGQSNERVATLGTLQERAFAYGKLRSDALHVRLLLSENVAGDFHKSIGADELTEVRRGDLGCGSGDRECGHRDPIDHIPRHPRIRTASRGRELSPQDPGKSSRALEGDAEDHPGGPRRGSDAFAHEV
jgi:hypothetical protein